MKYILPKTQAIFFTSLASTDITDVTVLIDLTDLEDLT